MLREHARSFSTLKLITDLGFTLVSLFLAGFIYHHTFSIHNLPSLDITQRILPVFLVWWVVFKSNHLYTSQRFQSLYSQIAQVIKAVMTAAVVLLAVNYLFDLYLLNKFFFFCFLTLNILLLSIEKASVFWLIRFFRKIGLNARYALIIGEPDCATSLLQTFAHNKHWGIQPIGLIAHLPNQTQTVNFYDRFHEAFKHHVSMIQPQCPLLGSVSDLSHLLEKRAVDMVFFAVSPQEIPSMQWAMQFCLQRGIPVKIHSPFLDSKPHYKLEIDDLGDLSCLSYSTATPSPSGWLVKDCIDRVLALFGTLLLSPLLIGTAIAIKLDSPGPVFFKQQRVGRNGRLFSCYKFRSMVVNAEAKKQALLKYNEMSGPAFKMKDDPRVTRVGRIIRKTSIDELPQLFNVFMGHMSLVGPRPPLPSEVEKYDNWQRRRLSMKPGLTCTWQAYGRNTIKDFEQWMKMDLEYIDNWSLKRDFSLIFQTILTVLTLRGAS